jgi:hypothetical protein
VKIALIVVAAATLGLSACGSDDESSSTTPDTPQGALAAAVIDEYDSAGLETDEDCVIESTSTLTDEQAERALSQFEQPTIDEDLQGWLDSLSACIKTS